MDAPDKRKMFYDADANVFRKASWLRTNETEAEKKLWTQLSKNQMKGFRFKRQHPIGYYIADFYCHKARLVIEVDGPSHDGPQQKLHDELRTDEFKLVGLNVIRFTNEDVLTKIEEVVKVIARHLPT